MDGGARRDRRRLALTAGVLLLAGAAWVLAPTGADGDTGPADRGAAAAGVPDDASRDVPRGPDDLRDLRDLLKVYRLTAPFHDARRAIAAGWTEQPMCMDYPDGYLGEPPGAMGHHFFNEAYLGDGGRIDPEEPELVIYEKRADGRWRMVAVEYVVSAKDRAGTDPAPELFGQEFTWHPDVGAAGVWGLHVWLWRANPHGFFASVNPRVSCAHSTPHGGHHLP